MAISKMKGTLDYFGDQLNGYRFIEQVAKECCRSYNFKELILPTFEATELFARGVRDGWKMWGNQATEDYEPDWNTYANHTVAASKKEE